MAGPPPAPGGPRSALARAVARLAVAAVGALALAGIALLEALARAGALWGRAERWLLGAVMGALAALVAAQALGQKAGFPFTWTEEISTIAVALVVWLALPSLVSEGHLLSLETGPLASRRWARALAGLATAAFLALVLLLALRAMPPLWSLRTPTLGLPRRLIWFLLPLAIALCLCAAAHRATTQTQRRP